jgi:Gluconate 2-dehydrogenase subunit 3
MSLRNPIDLRQDRRQWLKTSATLLGASVLPVPVETAGAAPKTQSTPKAPPPQAHETRSAARFFTLEQHALVDELTETIIPEDSHSGGAKAARVTDFIDKTLRETQDEDQKRTWKEGLPLIDSMSRHYHGKSYVDASPEERNAVLAVLSENERMTDIPEVKFFKDLKHLTVIGYYTSKVGIHDDLQYKGNRVLQEYVGCDDQGAAKT